MLFAGSICALYDKLEGDTKMRFTSMIILLVSIYAALFGPIIAASAQDSASQHASDLIGRTSTTAAPISECPMVALDPVTGTPLGPLPLNRNPYCNWALRLPVPVQVPSPAATNQATQPERMRASVVVGTNLNIGRQPANQHEPMIAINPMNHNQLVAVSNTDEVAGGLFSAYSTDGGTTWNTKRLFDVGPQAACCDPQGVFDRFGNFFLVYLGLHYNADLDINEYNVYLAMSTDGGQTFPTITQLTTSGTNDQPSLAVGPSYLPGSDSIWVTYNNDDRIAARGALVSGLGSVGPFNPAQEAPGTRGSFGNIAIGPAGQVLVTYQDGGDHANIGPSRIFVNLDPDGLQSDTTAFGAQITVAVTQVGSFRLIPAQSNDYGIDAEANLAWDYSSGSHKGRVYLVYTDAANELTNDTDIMLRYSDDSGATWSAPLRVNDDSTNTSQFLPAIAIDRTNGHVGVAWYDSRNDPAQNTTARLYAAVSDNGGSTLSRNFPVANGESNSSLSEPPVDVRKRPLGYGDYNLIDFDGGVLVPVWADNSSTLGGNPDLNHLDLATAKVLINSTAVSLTISGGNPQSALVNTPYATPLTVSLTDNSGHPVSSAPIEFSAPVTGASVLLSNPVVLTDLSGSAVVTATANDVAGNFQVTALVSGTTTVTHFDLINATSIFITATTPISQSTEVDTAFGANLDVTVRDVLGNGVARVPVMFAAPPGGPSTGLPVSATTDALGVASVGAIANTVSGSYTVTATVAHGAEPAVFYLTNLPGAPVSLIPVDGITRTVFMQSTTALTVSVQDAFGNGVPDVAVTFAAPDSGPSADLSAQTVFVDGSKAASVTLMSNSAGMATVFATANVEAGRYVITAQSSGLGPVNFELTNVPTHLYLPHVVRPVAPPKPDLVGIFIISPNVSQFAAGEPVEITAVITNQGGAATGPFWTDLLINPSTPPASANVIWNKVCGMTPCFGIAWAVPSLAAGQSITLTSTEDSFAKDYTTWPGWFAVGTSDLYLYVDSYDLSSPTGAVQESDESNNRFEQHGLDVSGVNPAQASASGLQASQERPSTLSQ